MTLLRTFRYLKEVHSANLDGNVEMRLCDRASLETESAASLASDIEVRQKLPFKFILYYIHDLLWKSLDLLVAQVDCDAWLQLITHTAGLGSFRLIFIEGILHCFSRKYHHLSCRDRDLRGQRRVRCRMSYGGVIRKSANSGQGSCPWEPIAVQRPAARLSRRSQRTRWPLHCNSCLRGPREGRNRACSQIGAVDVSTRPTRKGSNCPRRALGQGEVSGE